MAYSQNSLGNGYLALRRLTGRPVVARVPAGSR